MSIKLLKARLKNFGKFVDFEIEFKGKITKLIGVNGSGKTTIGKIALPAAVYGLSLHGKEYVHADRQSFIGNHGKSALSQVTLYDEEKKVKIIARNVMTKSGNKIEFEAPPKYIVDEPWIKETFPAALLSADDFCSIPDTEKAKILGIDLTEFDVRQSDLKTRFTELNADLKALGTIEKIEETKAVNITDILNERQKRQTFNKEQSDRQRNLNGKQQNIDFLMKSKRELEEKLRQTTDNIELLLQQKAELPTPEPELDLDDLDKQLRDAQEINRRADRYQLFREKKKKQNTILALIEKNKKLKKANTDARLAYISKFDFGFENLNVDESGRLLLNGRPISEPYYSKGELERIVAAIWAKVQPRFKFRYVDNFDLLDEENQAALLKHLLENGFQVVVGIVGKEKEVGDDTAVLLRKCKIVESYNDETDKNIPIS